MSQASLMRAWLLIVGVHDPTWNLEIMRRSSMMLMTKLVELINNGTSGLSRARVQSDTATCIADDNAETEEMRTYVMDASLTCAGTNAAASWLEAAINTMVMIAPSRVWKRIRVYDKPSREDIVLVALSPMTSQAALGRPSFRTLATVPM